MTLFSFFQMETLFLQLSENSKLGSVFVLKFDVENEMRLLPFADWQVAGDCWLVVLDSSARKNAPDWHCRNILLAGESMRCPSLLASSMPP
jgi:hypothetical protein